MSFDIYLPSNSVSLRGPNYNTCARFVTHLPQTLRLNSKWRVGLKQISFTNSTINVKSSPIYYTYSRPMTSQYVDVHEFPNNLEIPSGHYSSPAVLVKTINDLIASSALKYFKQWKSIPFLTWDETTNQISVITGHTEVTVSQIYLRFSQEFERHLGFTKKKGISEYYPIDPENVKENALKHFSNKTYLEKIDANRFFEVKRHRLLETNNIERNNEENNNRNTMESVNSSTREESTGTQVPPRTSTATHVPPIIIPESRKQISFPETERNTEKSEDPVPDLSLSVASGLTSEDRSDNSKIDETRDQSSSEINEENSVQPLADNTVRVEDLSPVEDKTDETPSTANVGRVEDLTSTNTLGTVSTVPSVDSSSEPVKPENGPNAALTTENTDTDSPETDDTSNPVEVESTHFKPDFTNSPSLVIVYPSNMARYHYIGEFDWFSYNNYEKLIVGRKDGQKPDKNGPRVEQIDKSIVSNNQIADFLWLSIDRRTGYFYGIKKNREEMLTLDPAIFPDYHHRKFRDEFNTYEDNYIDFQRGGVLLNDIPTDIGFLNHYVFIKKHILNNTYFSKVYDSYAVLPSPIGLTKLPHNWRQLMHEYEYILADQRTGQLIGKRKETATNASLVASEPLITNNINTIEFDISELSNHMIDNFAWIHINDSRKAVALRRSDYSEKIDFYAEGVEEIKDNDWLTNPLDYDWFTRALYSNRVFGKKRTTPLVVNSRKRRSAGASPVGQYYHCKADYACDYKGGIYSFLVYCNIVENSVIGNTMAPLLSVINTPPSTFNFGDQYYEIFNNISYKKLSIYEFDEIEIHIRTDGGELVPFEFGRVYITLHFEKDESL